MGGRGASLGISDKGKRYGAEYKAYGQIGNVKIVKYKDSKSITAPMETMPPNRVYATLDRYNDVKFITFYDANGERSKQIDLKGTPHGDLDIPHAHYGYEHNENGDGELSDKDKAIVDKIVNYWSRKRKRLNM